MLDASLRDALDMSEMTRSMVDQLILSRDAQATFSDYSSDFTSSSSSSPSSVGSKSPFDDSGDSESEARQVSRGGSATVHTTLLKRSRMFLGIECEGRRVMEERGRLRVRCKNELVVESRAEVDPWDSARCTIP